MDGNFHKTYFFFFSLPSKKYSYITSHENRVILYIPLFSLIFSVFTPRIICAAIYTFAITYRFIWMFIFISFALLLFLVLFFLLHEKTLFFFCSSFCFVHFIQPHFEKKTKKTKISLRSECLMTIWFVWHFQKLMKSIKATKESANKINHAVGMKTRWTNKTKGEEEEERGRMRKWRQWNSTKFSNISSLISSFMVKRRKEMKNSHIEKRKPQQKFLSENPNIHFTSSECHSNREKKISYKE